MVKVFVSHADGDKQIALPFVELLKNGVGISDVFCSPTKGAIPNGQFFAHHIFAKLHDADATIELLSSNHLKSEFCVAELGHAIASTTTSSCSRPRTMMGNLVQSSSLTVLYHECRSRENVVLRSKAGPAANPKPKD
jgi:hypothetical protein